MKICLICLNKFCRSPRLCLFIINKQNSSLLMSLVISLSSRDVASRGCFCALFVDTNEISVLVFIKMSNLCRSLACMKLIAPRLVFIVIKSLDLEPKNQHVTLLNGTSVCLSYCPHEFLICF